MLSSKFSILIRSGAYPPGMKKRVVKVSIKRMIQGWTA
jgi:hypothetical protein